VDILHELTRKPWLSDPAEVADEQSGKSFPLPVEKLGLRVFLAVVTVLFTLVIVVYSDRMSLADWRPLQEPWSLWLNTVLLILASVAFQWALVNARRGTIEGVRTGLNAAGVLTFAFLLGQLWVAQQLSAMGYYATESPAVAFLYLMSAMHGLHLLGGLVVWYRASARMRRGENAAQLYLSVELCAIYWHYLLAIWVVLFSLLLLT
jgi:cytochrome c oxidase subunit 3